MDEIGPLLPLLEDLRGVALFDSVGRECSARLLPHVRTRSFVSGDVLFSHGEECSDLWAVLSGQVALLEGRDGRLLGRRESGELIGEAVVFDPHPWSFSAVATTEGSAAWIDHGAVLEWVCTEPPAARWFLRHFAGRVQHEVSVNAARPRLDVGARVAGTVLTLADRYTIDGVVRHGLSQQRLADLAGASREAVNKTLADFAEQGWLVVQRGACVVRDEDALRLRAGGAAPPGQDLRTAS